MVGCVVDARNGRVLHIVHTGGPSVALAACTDGRRAIEEKGTLLPCIFNIDFEKTTDEVIAGLETDEERRCAEASRADREHALQKYAAAEDKKAFKRKIKIKILELLDARSVAFMEQLPGLKTVTIDPRQFHFWACCGPHFVSVYMTAYGCVVFPMDQVSAVKLAPMHGASPSVIVKDAIMGVLITHSSEKDVKLKRTHKLIEADTHIVFQPRPGSIVYDLPPQAFELTSAVPAQGHSLPAEAFLIKLTEFFGCFGDVEFVDLPDEAHHPTPADIVAFKGATAAATGLPGEDNADEYLSPAQIFAVIHKHSDYIFKTVIGADEVSSARIPLLPLSPLVRFFLNCYPQWGTVTDEEAGDDGTYDEGEEEGEHEDDASEIEDSTSVDEDCSEDESDTPTRKRKREADDDNDGPKKKQKFIA